MDAAPEDEEVKDSHVTKFPVSAAWSPPFTIFVNLVGHGDSFTGEDVSNEVTNWYAIRNISPVRYSAAIDGLLNFYPAFFAGGASSQDCLLPGNLE